MTDRLAQALKQLSPDDLAQVARFAEDLSRDRSAALLSIESESPRFDWMGGLADLTDVDAHQLQQDANELRVRLVQQNVNGLPK